MKKIIKMIMIALIIFLIFLMLMGVNTNAMDVKYSSYIGNLTNIKILYETENFFRHTTFTRIQDNETKVTCYIYNVETSEENWHRQYIGHDPVNTINMECFTDSQITAKNLGR